MRRNAITAFELVIKERILTHMAKWWIALGYNSEAKISNTRMQDQSFIQVVYL